MFSVIFDFQYLFRSMYPNFLKSRLLPSIFAILISFFSLNAQSVVSTFESAGITWKADNGAENLSCEVKYCVQGTESWNDAMPLWYDSRSRTYKGSIVHLKPGTKYTVDLRLADGSEMQTVHFSTWNEEFPVAETIYLPEHSDETLKINRSGSANGYILYTFKAGSEAVIDVDHRSANCIQIAEGVSHVMLRGLTLKGAGQNAIVLNDNVHDIVIEGNDISGWGHNNQQGFGARDHAAIFSKNAENISRLIIQRNKMHHPDADSNSWEEYRDDKQTYHPGGPQAISLHNTAGNHVIRYNEIYSDDEHYFRDAFGGGTNFSDKGFPNKDSDIYGNYIERCWDDGIESEGANENVRIWGNYIDKTYVKIAIATTSVGPLYVWRNVANTSRKSAVNDNPDEYGRGPFIKAGGKKRKEVFYGGGKTYIFHNTVLQEKSSGRASLGGRMGIQDSGGKLLNVVSRNNIFINSDPSKSTIKAKVRSCTNDFDYDLYNGKANTGCETDQPEKHGIRLRGSEKPTYDSRNQEGEYALKKGTPGHDQGQILPNFNDDFEGKGPDMGAFEAGSDAMQFGTEAYLEK